MKKLTKWMAIIGIIVMMNFNSYSQVSVLGNAGAVGNYVGWNAAQPFPVTVAHKGNFPILFETNGINRMILDNGGGGQAGGRLALGNNLPAGFAPQSRMHIHQVGVNNNATYIRFTNSLTGALNTDGFAIGNSSNLFPPPSGEVNMFQYEQAPIIMLAPMLTALLQCHANGFVCKTGKIFPYQFPGVQPMVLLV